VKVEKQKVEGHSNHHLASSNMSCSDSIPCLNGGVCASEMGTALCACSFEFEGPKCENASIIYEASFGSLYAAVMILVVAQLFLTVKFDGRRTTFTSILLGLTLLASASRVASHVTRLYESLPASVPENLGDLFYPLMFIGLGLTVCVWAEVYHERLNYTTVKSFVDANWQQMRKSRFLNNIRDKMARRLLRNSHANYGACQPACSNASCSLGHNSVPGSPREPLQLDEVEQAELARKINTSILPFGAVRFFFGLFALLLGILEVTKWSYTGVVEYQANSTLVGTLSTLRQLYNGFVAFLLLAFTVVFACYGAELFIKLRVYRAPSGQKTWQWKFRARLGFLSLIICTFLSAGLRVASLYNLSPLVLNMMSILSPVIEFFLLLWFPCALWRTSTSLNDVWVVNPRGGSPVPGEDSRSKHAVSPEQFTVVPLDGECYVCLDDTTTAKNPLIAPCLCSGSTRLIHRDCLRHWLVSSEVATGLPKCNICGAEYAFQYSSTAAAKAILTHPQSMRDVLGFCLSILGLIGVICALSVIPGDKLNLFVRLWLVLLTAAAMMVVVRAFAKKLKQAHLRGRSYGFVFVSRSKEGKRGPTGCESAVASLSEEGGSARAP